jgi:hypothetical protein
MGGGESFYSITFMGCPQFQAEKSHINISWEPRTDLALSRRLKFTETFCQGLETTLYLNSML